MKPTKLQQANKAAAIIDLLSILNPGDTVHTILRHVSKSGMMRHISMVVVKDDRAIDITYLSALVMTEKRADDGGIKASGGGMDMGFNLVYNLGATLWPNGTPEPHGTRNSEPDSTGGYALKHRWM